MDKAIRIVNQWGVNSDAVMPSTMSFVFGFVCMTKYTGSIVTEEKVFSDFFIILSDLH